MTGRVVCVGDLMTDVLARLPGPLAPGSDTPSRIGLFGGGAAANVAVGLATAGLDAVFVGRIGHDALGRHAVAELAAHRVTPAISHDPLRASGTCIVLVAPDGERTMIPDAGANAGLGEVDPATLPEAADCLYLSGYALLDSGARPFALAALAHARDRGWLIAVDAASAAPLAAIGADVFGRWVGRGVVLFANEDETRVLLGGEPDDPARALAAQYGEAVVKLGAAGAVWSDGVDECVVGARPTTVIDTTGAGDALSAGFLSARLAGGDARACLERGAEFAARVVSQVGARPR
ncbi:MAG TPA: PfkB family carbohydrate kinase [Jatrophihabitans sp.]|jgi:sugar/nucleoside kinase (ribokinase family)|uniref:carbohydrate kinase family protein n=1 Tax=Jatrophihabitans sp. TaxID=1932789 RepID=UPI002DF8B0E4|nr:PfkB family carbohydrate kinase [Jatrophihabitans sp.]